MTQTIDPTRLRALLREQALRFCGDRHRDAEVARLLREGAADVAALRAIADAGGEPAFFAAIALASVGDASALSILRDPHNYFMTNSCVELGLSLCARLALNDVQPPLHFLNPSLLGELAELVGAFPPSVR
jgi:hypothetical protein